MNGLERYSGLELGVAGNAGWGFEAATSPVEPPAGEGWQESR